MNDKSDLEQRIANYRLSDPMIILVGPMGAGKSTIGRRLAHKLHLDFVDIDKEVEATAGCPITEIFQQNGEEGFRKRETEALETFCCLSGTVIATGGGAILSEANRRMMRNGLVIYLHTSPEQQFQRIKNRAHRPNFDPTQPAHKLTAMMEIREPLYRAEADFTVNTDQQTIESLTRTIADHLLDQ